MEFPDLDSPSAGAIIAMLLEDLTTMDSIDSANANVANQYMIRELQKAQRTLADRIVAESIGQATRTDSHLVRKHVREERLAQRDRELALELAKNDGEGELSAVALDEVAESEDSDADGNTTPETLPTLDGTVDTDSEADELLVDVPASVPREPCISCLTDLPPDSLLYADCDHAYCAGCMRNLFRASFRDESLFPPRCCRKPLPTTHNRFIGRRLGAEYAEKDREFSTPAAQRTYCHNTDCGVFIPHPPITAQAAARRTGAEAGDVVTCTKCAHRTCVHCKNQEHQGANCPPDETTLARTCSASCGMTMNATI
ncbi:hypothetical protein BROUX41_002384 [Berkeleyomyces rouxiae]|uniref:uncharacterized protein n=1 Tax=Berkeleyomyces rouxiae TaxID=2035830 RepID=UPI003B7AD73A